MASNPQLKLALCAALVGAGGSLLLNRLPGNVQDRIEKVPGIGLWKSLESAQIHNVLIALALIMLGGILLAGQFGVSFSGGTGAGQPGLLGGIIPELGF